MLQHAVDAAARSPLDEVVVVLGHEAELVASHLRLPHIASVVVNDEYESGQSTSLRVGLDAIDPRSDAALILLGDQPRLPASAIRKVLAAFEATGSLVVRASWEGTPGHPVVVARSEWEAFRQAQGDKGARELISNLPHVDVDMNEPPPDDVDTWDQYERVRKDHS